MTIAFGVLVIFWLFMIYRMLRQIATNQIAQSTHRANIHRVEIVALNAIKKAVQK